MQHTLIDFPQHSEPSAASARPPAAALSAMGADGNSFLCSPMHLICVYRNFDMYGVAIRECALPRRGLGAFICGSFFSETWLRRVHIGRAETVEIYNLSSYEFVSSSLLIFILTAPHPSHAMELLCVKSSLCVKSLSSFAFRIEF